MLLTIDAKDDMSVVGLCFVVLRGARDLARFGSRRIAGLALLLVVLSWNGGGGDQTPDCAMVHCTADNLWKCRGPWSNVYCTSASSYVDNSGTNGTSNNESRGTNASTANPPTAQDPFVLPRSLPGGAKAGRCREGSKGAWAYSGEQGCRVRDSLS